MADADVDGSHIRTLLLTLLYRQTTALIKGGFVYIAQPPLYKIKRGQREEYIQTEEQMNSLLLDLGCEGLKLTNLKTKQTYTENQLKDILAILAEMEQYARILEKKGVNFAEYLLSRNQKTKKLPIYRVIVEGNAHFVYNDAELSKLAATDKPEDKKEITDLLEGQDIEKLIQKLEKFDLDVLTYANHTEARGDLPPSKETKKPKPNYRVVEEKQQFDFVNLRDLLAHVKLEAQKGMNIQRYKGLGEMNPQQLWDTTLDPEKRTLLKVTLEDAVETDRMFSVLMGDDVEPRREFIESYAHQVKNLDI